MLKGRNSGKGKGRDKESNYARGSMSWVLFILLILIVLVLDLFVFHKKTHLVTFKEACISSSFTIFLALLFGLYVYWAKGSVSAVNYYTGYLIEKMLSVDNLFVILLIFNYFKIQEQAWHKVLFWGILGAIVMRAIFILFGLTLVQLFHPMIFLFGAFLIYSGLRLTVQKTKKIAPGKNLLLKLSARLFPLDENYKGNKFFVKKQNRLFATPLWIALLAIETTDILFAVDSIPAILAITYDPFIVYSSNIFALIGLRSLFFLLASSLRLFRYLHYGISLILIFVGLKMVLSDYVKVPPLIALAIVSLILVLSILLSLLFEKKDTP